MTKNQTGGGLVFLRSLNISESGENMNKPKEFMFMGRNVIENMNNSTEFMFRDQNVVETMDNRQISMFSACRNT